MKRFFKKLNSRGISHDLVIPIIAVLLVGGIGVAVATKISNASTCYGIPYSEWKTSKSGTRYCGCQAGYSADANGNCVSSSSPQAGKACGPNNAIWKESGSSWTCACKDGYNYNNNGNCVKSAKTVDVNPKKLNPYYNGTKEGDYCKNSMQWIIRGGKCSQICFGSNKAYNKKDSRCRCINNTGWTAANGGTCVKCPYGVNSKNNQCNPAPKVTRKAASTSSSSNSSNTRRTTSTKRNCGPNTHYNSRGTCVCDSGYRVVNGSCIKKTSTSTQTRTQKPIVATNGSSYNTMSEAASACLSNYPTYSWYYPECRRKSSTTGQYTEIVWTAKYR